MDTAELDIDLLLLIIKNIIFDATILSTAIVDLTYLLYFRQQRLEETLFRFPLLASSGLHAVSTRHTY